MASPAFRFFLGFVVLALLGCGNSNLPRTAPVSGTVTYRGKPVESGAITFYPASGERPAFGKLEAGGKFTMSTFGANDGVVLGKSKVAIQSYKNTADVSTGNSGGSDSAIPVKYTSQTNTPLEVEVKENGNEFRFELQD